MAWHWELGARCDMELDDLSAEPVSLDAWRSFAGTGGPGFRNVIEQLINRDFTTGEFVPLLATSWERMNDTTIRFTLRQGVTFHHGSPFNAEGAAASINHTFPHLLGHCGSIFGRRCRRRNAGG